MIGMEACASAHHWGRELQSRGYTVKLIPPQFVKPYVKSNKNDARDAEAICEAMSRPNMRFVTVKTVEQQDIQATHRIREELNCSAHRQGSDPGSGGRVWPGGADAHEFTACSETVLAGRCRERIDALLPIPVARSVGGSADTGLHVRDGRPSSGWLRKMKLFDSSKYAVSVR